MAAPAEGAPAEAPATGVVATSAVQVTVLAQGHASLAAIAPGTAAPRTSGELWGLSAHSSAEAWASAGDDGAVQLWLAGHVAPAAGAYLAGGAGSRAVAFGPEVGDGGQRSAVLAVALRDGSVRLLDAALAPQPRLVPRGDGAGTVHTGRRECTVLRFSPCGCWLAVGSRDKTIDLFDARAAPPAKARAPESFPANDGLPPPHRPSASRAPPAPAPAPAPGWGAERPCGGPTPAILAPRPAAGGGGAGPAAAPRVAGRGRLRRPAGPPRRCPPPAGVHPPAPAEGRLPLAR